VIDNSASIGSSNWPVMIDFVESIIGFFSVGVDATRFALVDFGTSLICNDY